MITLNSDLTKGLDLLASRLNSNTNKLQQQDIQKAEVNSFHIKKSQQQGFTFFYRSVQSSVEASLDAKPTRLEKEMAEKQLEQQDKRSDIAANNILKFIEKQLNIDAENGADKDKLASRIDAALEGFNIGYSEANDTLKEMQLLSPELANEIGMTQEKVLAGIDKLKQEFLGIQPSQNDDIESEISEPKSTTTRISNEQAFVSSQKLEQANDFTFELTTSDGDKVTIHSSALQSKNEQGGFYSGEIDGNEVQLAYLSRSGIKESNFSFSVEGELDKSELKAINNLLNNVNDLASDFYSGDVETAFNKALELGYDANEISEFSISMTQIKNYTAYQAYQTDKTLFNNNNVQELKPLAEFSKQISASLDSLKKLFDHPRDLMSDVMKQINTLQKPDLYPENKNDFLDFAGSLLDKYAQLDEIKQ